MSCTSFAVDTRELDACKVWPCRQSTGPRGGPASCFDHPGGINSTAGRLCNCTSKLMEYNEALGCQGMR